MTMRPSNEVEDGGPPALATEELTEVRTQSDLEDDAYRPAVAWLSTLGIWVGVAATVVLVLLGFRLGFLMAEANAANSFVDFIYDVSGPLVQPFQSIAENRTLDSGGVFEPAAVIAMGVYLVAALLTIAMLWALAAAPWSAQHRTVTRRRQVMHH
ncbi:MAG: hypothetical protein WEE64_03245 [Dehalococcoidia bacterium]